MKLVCSFVVSLSFLSESLRVRNIRTKFDIGRQDIKKRH